MAAPLARPAAFVVVACLSASAGIAAQRGASPPGPLQPFGVGEAPVRSLLIETVSRGDIAPTLVGMITQGYQRIPATMRGPATTAAFVWAKAWVNSPAFATVYAQARDADKPAGLVDIEPIDVAVQKKLATLIAELEEAKKNLSMIDADARVKIIKGFDDQIAVYKSPETARQYGIGMEIERASANEDNAKKAEEFVARWPADPKVFVRGQLERFMTVTATIDHSLPQIWVKDPSGRIAGFLSPGLEDISWEHLHAILAGKDAVDAARTFVGAWLKELP